MEKKTLEIYDSVGRKIALETKGFLRETPNPWTLEPPFLLPLREGVRNKVVWVAPPTRSGWRNHFILSWIRLKTGCLRLEHKISSLPPPPESEGLLDPHAQTDRFLLILKLEDSLKTAE